MNVEFKAWPKIPRWNSEGIHVVITEKIDGTNGCLIIENNKMVGVQSRNTMLAHLANPDDPIPTRYSDNYGFAHWALTNHDALVELLGDGYHYGEWAGPGIQKNPLNFSKKRFFLFNTKRWYLKFNVYEVNDLVSSVPVLYEGPYTPDQVEQTMQDLWYNRQQYAQKPEGIILFFPQMGSMMKYTYENTEGKWKSA